MDINLLAYVIAAIAGVMAWIGGAHVCHAVQGWMDHRDPRIRASLDRAAHWPK